MQLRQHSKKLIDQNIINMTNSLTHQQLSQIIELEYEIRTRLQHKFIIDFIQLSFGSSCSIQKARTLSMFIRTLKLEDGEEYQLDSLTLVFTRREEQADYQVQQLMHKTVINKHQADQLFVIQRTDILKCEALKWNYLEQQVNFLKLCPVLSDVSKKLLLSLFRQADVRRYRYGEIVYKGGEPMKNCYYLVRSGQFSFISKQVTSNNAELLVIRAGYIYQHSRNNNNRSSNFDIIQTLSTYSPSLPYTIKCKSSSGVIFSIDREFFQTTMPEYCQEKLTEHINHQFAYLSGNAKKMIHRRSFSQSSLRQKPQSQQIMKLTAPILSFARSYPAKEEKEKEIYLLEKPSDYFTVKEQLPKRNRLYQKAQLKRLYPNPEENESDSLIWRKARCDRLKQLMRPVTRPPTKGQILFGFTKFTIDFHKHRKRPSLS